MLLLQNFASKMKKGASGYNASDLWQDLAAPLPLVGRGAETPCRNDRTAGFPQAVSGFKHDV